MKKSLPLAFVFLLLLSAAPLYAAAPVLAWHRFHHGGHFGRVHVRVGVGWGWGWGSPWGWYGPAYYARYPAYVYYAPQEWAVVSTDVSPEESRVYLEGRYIGTADDFDGWPDYLYLKRGHYRLEFRLEGYEPKTVEIDARPGTKFKVDDKLQKISGAKQYGTYDNSQPPGGIQRFWGKRQGSTEALTEDALADDGSYTTSEDGRAGDRPKAERGRSTAGREPSELWRKGGREAVLERGVEQSARARLKLHVQPADAAVYVDDRFVGTAEEISSLERGLSVSPGKHTVTASRPGFKDRSVNVSVQAGESEPLDLKLER